VKPSSSPSPHWLTARFEISLGRPRVMGIVNVTPDSFSDGGQHAEVHSAQAWCDRLLEEGADILDIGGESTRPGARPPSAQEERDRVIPVVRHAVKLGCPVSIDTSEPLVMREALDLGADIINDVRALRRPGALEVVAAHPRAGACLMHMKGEPTDMQAAPHYDKVLDEVAQFLTSRRDAAQRAGIGTTRLVLDPGFGFGKTLDHNLVLTQGLGRLTDLGLPLLVGWSRKGSLAGVTGRPSAADRVAASLAAALACVAQGARIVRVHDVAATVDALKVWEAMRPSPSPMPLAALGPNDNPTAIQGQAQGI
jgi:dihydropteroate synthase